MRTAIYARVSTKDKGQDTENQMLQLRKYVEHSRWSVVGEYVDRASAKTGDRPEFKRLMEDATKKLFDVVLFWSLDRFSREGIGPTIGYLDKLTQLGIKYHSYTEPYIDSSGFAAEVITSILAAVAKQERVRISERVVAGLERAKKEGKQLGRPRVIVNRDKVVEMRKGGMTLGAIAREHNTSTSTVFRLLKGSRW